mmetsp:Transcript_28395/g.71313  ORF Transcript_28395/g.71313 Transcript_28395/m.71313 type:complete len:232 (-) Transcript_28395:108-803(-)
MQLDDTLLQFENILVLFFDVDQRCCCLIVFSTVVQHFALHQLFHLSFFNDFIDFFLSLARSHNVDAAFHLLTVVLFIGRLDLLIVLHEVQKTARQCLVNIQPNSGVCALLGRVLEVFVLLVDCLELISNFAHQTVGFVHQRFQLIGMRACAISQMLCGEIIDRLNVVSNLCHARFDGRYLVVERGQLFFLVVFFFFIRAVFFVVTIRIDLNFTVINVFIVRFHLWSSIEKL